MKYNGNKHSNGNKHPWFLWEELSQKVTESWFGESRSGLKHLFKLKDEATLSVESKYFLICIGLSLYTV